MTDVAAIRWVFFLQPIVLGAWFPRIPQVQSALGLSEGALALALMGLPAGLLIALTFGGRLAEALGTRKLLSWGLGAYLLLMPLPAFALSGVTLFGALVITGTALAIAELSLNVSAAEVEKRAGASIMNTAHGFWSVGVLTGSAIGAAQAAFGMVPYLALVLLSVLAAVPLLRIAASVTNYAVDAAPKDAGTRRLPSKALMCVAIFAFGIAMTEGAMADWAAVYLTQVFAASPGVAGMSFTTFAAFVAIGRFQGDALKRRFSADRMARVFGGMAIVGLVVTVIAPTQLLVFLGMALLGYGVSLGFPLAVSAASALPGRSSAANVAVLTQLTLCGFLVGPPVIGFIAQVSDMRWGLSALLPALIVAFWFAGSLKPETEH